MQLVKLEMANSHHVRKMDDTETPYVAILVAPSTVKCINIKTLESYVYAAKEFIETYKTKSVEYIDCLRLTSNSLIKIDQIYQNRKNKKFYKIRSFSLESTNDSAGLIKVNYIEVVPSTEINGSFKHLDLVSAQYCRTYSEFLYKFRKVANG